jgi:hypothetical protein
VTDERKRLERLHAERPREYREGVRLFDEGRYWDAHEAWEEIWREQPKGSDARRFYQGLILLAAAFLHRERAMTNPSRSVPPALRCYRSALEKLAPLGDAYLDLDLVSLRIAARDCFEPLAGSDDLASVVASLPAAPSLQILRRR